MFSGHYHEAQWFMFSGHYHEAHWFMFSGHYHGLCAEKIILNPFHLFIFTDETKWKYNN
jgi:hypothetical protein